VQRDIWRWRVGGDHEVLNDLLGTIRFLHGEVTQLVAVKQWLRLNRSKLSAPRP
jgi:hypothetical protein